MTTMVAGLRRMPRMRVTGLAGLSCTPHGQAVVPPALLSGTEAAEYLGISRGTWCRLLPRAKARGLRSVTIPGRADRGIVRYTRASLDAMVAKAAEAEGDLC
jgi:hypothetical protein